MTVVKRTPSPYDGKRAKIIAKDHPWYDNIAYCRGAEHTIVGLAMVFEDVESGAEFMVFKGNEIKWID